MNTPVTQEFWPPEVIVRYYTNVLLYTNHIYLYFLEPFSLERRYPVVYNRFEPDKEQHFIQICACKRGLKAIDSPLKVKIIEMLAGGEMDFEDIVSRSGRAKSTISAHLNALTEAGITISRPDPADARRRLFSLKGKILLRTVALDRDMKWVDQFFPEKLPANATTRDVFSFILTTLRVSLIAEGIEIHPILSQAGRRVGRAIYPRVQEDDTPAFFSSISQFWVNFGLGKMDLEREDPFTIVIRDCFECMALPLTGKPECSFGAGVLSALFSSHFGEAREAIEKNCYATGSNLCRFEIWNAR